MSFNFTGKPKGRSINLGNRGLSGHDRKSFLQTVKRDREERAQKRRKISAATMIQAAVRAMEDLDSKRGQLGAQWAGRLEEFCFFYPYVVLRQDFEVSKHQLAVLGGQLGRGPPARTLRNVVRALVDADMRLVAACGGKYPENAAEYVELVKMSIPAIQTAIAGIGAYQSAAESDGTAAQVSRLLALLFDLFHVEKQLEQSTKEIVDWIFDFSTSSAYKPKRGLVSLLSKYRHLDVVDAMLAPGADALRLAQFLDALMQDFVEFGKSLDLAPGARVVFLGNVCRLYQHMPQRTPAVMRMRNLEFFAALLPQCHCQGSALYFASQFAPQRTFVFTDENPEISGQDSEQDRFFDDDIKNDNCRCVIAPCLEEGIAQLYTSGDAARTALQYCAEAPALCATFIYELLQLVAPQGTARGGANARLESTLLYSLISGAGPSAPAVFLHRDSVAQEFWTNYSFESLSGAAEIAQYFGAMRNPALVPWWRGMYVALMMYSRMVSSMSNSAMVRLLREPAFSSLLFFSKDLAVKTVLYAHQYLQSAQGVRFDAQFEQVVMAALALLRLVYRRNLRVKMLPDQYWALGDFKAAGVLPLLGAIAQMHRIIDLRDEDDSARGARMGAGNPTLQLLRGEPLFSASGCPALFRHIFMFDGERGDAGAIGATSATSATSAGGWRILPSSQYQALCVFSYIPYMVPFAQRAGVFHRLIAADRATFADEAAAARTRGTISRDNVLFDAFDQFYSMSGTAFKSPLAVQFVNSFGELEAGIDGGGLTKELLTSIVSTVFVPSGENIAQNRGYRFFDATTNHQLFPSADYFLQKQYVEQNPQQSAISGESVALMKRVDRFIGMVVGKCLYDNVLIDVSFAPFFLNLMMCCESCSAFTGAADTDRESFRNSYDDLQLFDPELYDNLEKLLRLAPGDVAGLGLSFCVTEKFEYRGTEYTLSVNLDDGVGKGAEKPVTAENRLQYVLALAKYKLNTRIQEQTWAFMDGLCQVIDEYWLTLFSPYELQTLISGGDKGIDVEDLRQNVVYGGYTPSSNTVRFLFEVLDEFSAQEKAKFVKFVTSSSRQPLLGFKELTPKFGIRNAGSDLTRLPTASTCVNLLKLPDYNDKDLLKQKLLFSINAQAGFDLS